MDESAEVRASMQRTRLDDASGQPLISAVALLQSAPTGARPLLVACDDGNQYWAKGPGNPHGNLALAHEWVVSELSRTLGGPTPPGNLIYLAPELLTGQDIDGRRRKAGTWFGSKLVEGEESVILQHARRDGNPQRVPKYLGLWQLCLGLDPQFIYERSSLDRMWSIDHGLWFNNGECDWNQGGGLSPLIGQSWEDPEWKGTQKLDPVACHAAATAVQELSPAAVGQIVATVPVDWEVPDSDLEELALFILARRERTASYLRIRANYC